MRVLPVDNLHKCKYNVRKIKLAEMQAERGETMVNVDGLKAALRDRNISIEQAAKEIGVDPVTFYRRLNQQGKKFTVQEVGKLAEMLKMDSETMQQIFFAK